ncbi:MAG: MurR/RpiR family transcriptional regulator [Bombilactobacillus sp.]
MNFDERIIKHTANFTDTEDEIVAYISQHKLEIENTKITFLAKKFYTVPNTITRLCHKLGYSGYSELKLSLKNERIQQRIEKFYDRELRKNVELAHELPLMKIINKLNQAKKINFYSMGQTAYITRLIVGNFYAVDYKSYFYDYPNDLKHIILHENDDLFFLISLSGEKKQMIDLAQEVKKRHNQLVTLTHLCDNSLAHLADISLFCYSPNRRIDEYNVTDKMPILLIMNELFKAYAKQLNKEIKIN